MAAKAIESLNSVRQRLDEESVTAALIGCLVASLPLSALARGESESEDYDFSWHHYRKQGSNHDAEPVSGADFALLLALPDGKKRLAIFQAKSDSSKSSKENNLNLSQCREVNGKKVLQLKTLVATARKIIKNNPRQEPGDYTRISSINWVHYFCQHKQGTYTIPLKFIARDVNSIINNTPESKKKIPIGDNTPKLGLMNLFRDAFKEKPQFWLNLTAATELPEAIQMTELGDLMDLYCLRTKYFKPQFDQNFEATNLTKSNIKPASKKHNIKGIKKSNSLT
ncbi:hypothetical protein [Xanthomonas translucens]|uniref:hypothetical protein n=1 Tax=Xanthomonas campestris pv. translucens TaxID=343 RepID=UPI003F7168B3